MCESSTVKAKGQMTWFSEPSTSALDRGCSVRVWGHRTLDKRRHRARNAYQSKHTDATGSWQLRVRRVRNGLAAAAYLREALDEPRLMSAIRAHEYAALRAR